MHAHHQAAPPHPSFFRTSPYLETQKIFLSTRARRPFCFKEQTQSHPQQLAANFLRYGRDICF